MNYISGLGEEKKVTGKGYLDLSHDLSAASFILLSLIPILLNRSMPCLSDLISAWRKVPGIRTSHNIPTLPKNRRLTTMFLNGPYPSECMIPYFQSYQIISILSLMPIPASGASNCLNPCQGPYL